MLWAEGDFGSPFKGDPYTLRSIDRGLLLAINRIVWFYTKGANNNFNFDPELPTILAAIYLPIYNF